MTLEEANIRLKEIVEEGKLLGRMMTKLREESEFISSMVIKKRKGK